MSRAMFVSEILIIYLAAGAPFGAMQLFKTRSGSANILRVATAFCLWPVIAFRLLLAPGKNGYLVDEFDDLDSFDAKIDLMVREILQDSGVRSQTFHAAIERYAALTSASLHFHRRSSQQEIEFLNIGGHENAELGAVCMHRKYWKQLISHQERASTDLVKAIDSFTDTKATNVRLVGMVAELCKALNDHSTKALVAESMRSKDLQAATGLSENISPLPSHILAGFEPKANRL